MVKQKEKLEHKLYTASPKPRYAGFLGDYIGSFKGRVGAILQETLLFTINPH